MGHDTAASTDAKDVHKLTPKEIAEWKKEHPGEKVIGEKEEQKTNIHATLLGVSVEGGNVKFTFSAGHSQGVQDGMKAELRKNGKTFLHFTAFETEGRISRGVVQGTADELSGCDVMVNPS